MNLCSYGCRQAGLFQLKNRKWCCCKDWHCCPNIRRKFGISKIGDKNPMKRPEVSKKVSRKGRKPWNTGKKRPPYSEGWCRNISKGLKGKKKLPWAEERKINKSNSIKEKWKDLTSKYNSIEFRDKVRSQCLNGHSAFMNSHIKNRSKPQTAIYENVKLLFPDLTIDIDYSFLNYNLDITILEYKIAIEYDGWCYHEGPRGNLKKDEEKQKRCEEYGWKFIRYKGTRSKDAIPSLEQLKQDITKKFGEVNV